MNKLSDWFKNAIVPIVVLSIAGIIYGFVEIITETKLNEKLYFGIITLGIVLIVWIVYSASQTKKSFGTTEKIGKPEGLWRLLFHELPTKSEKADFSKVEILIVHNIDEESKKIIKELKINFEEQKILKLNWFDTSLVRNNEKKLFEILLEKYKDELDGIYILYSDLIRDKNWVIECIVKWAVIYTDKPIVYVDISGKSNRLLTFGKVSIEEGGIGIWRLLERSSKRADSWKEQATIYRKIFIWFFWGTLFVGGGFIYLLNISKQKNISEKIKQIEILKKETDSLILEKKNNGYINTNLFDTYWTQLYWGQSFFSKNLDKNEFQAKVNQILSSILEELFNSFGQATTENYIALWYNFNDSCLQEVFWAKDKKRFCLPKNNESIIGCTFNEKNHFILWEKVNENLHKISVWEGGNDSVKVSWERKLTLGPDKKIVKSENINIYPENSLFPLCDYDIIVAERFNRNALICYSNIFPDSNKECGICIDVRTENTDFLYSKLFRKKMLYIVSLMQLIPKENIPILLDKKFNCETCK